MRSWGGAGSFELGRHVDWVPFVGGLISVGLVFLLNRNFLLNNFFREGAYRDVATIGGMIYHPVAALDVASAARGLFVYSSFYATHVSPTLVLLGLPTYFVSVNFVEFSAAFFAGVTTFVVAVFTFLIWRVARLGTPGWSRGWRAVLTTFAPLAIAFSGPVMVAVGHPHYEPLFAPTAAIFLLLVVYRRHVAAGLVLVACILTREDFAFHLFGFMVVWVGYQLLALKMQVRQVRIWLVYMAVSLAAGLVILLIQKSVFPGDDALARVYLGSPAFAHLTWPFFVDRIRALVSGRADLLVCASSASLIALLCRDWRYVIGYFACGPWLLLALVAKSDAAGSLSLYYGFPFVLAIFWPILAVFLQGMPRPFNGLSWRLMDRQIAMSETTLVVLLTLAGLVGSTFAIARTWPLREVVAQMRPVPTDLQAAGYAVQRMIESGALNRESIGIDGSVAALLPKSVRPEQVILQMGDVNRFAAVMFFATAIGDGDLLETLTLKDYSRVMRVGTSNIYIAQKPSPDEGRITESLRRSGDPVKLVQQSYLFSRLYRGPAGAGDADEIVSEPNVDGLVAYGPYLKLPAGYYRGEYKVSVGTCSGDCREGRFEVDVSINQASTSLAKKIFRIKDVFPDVAGPTAILALEFSVAPGQAELPVELLLRHFGGGRFAVEDVSIVPLPR